jgi:O-antigen biosynthesis protein WbqV
MLMGQEPDEIPIVFVGPRPGEKLFEELTAPSESNMATTHTNIKIFNRDSLDPRKLIASIDEAVDRVMAGADADTVRLILRELVPEYSPAQGSEYPKLSAYAGSRSS